MDPRERLKSILLKKSYQKKKVVLASGRESDFYFDGKQTSLSAEGAALLGELFFMRILDKFPEAEAVGGPTLGADPLVTAVSLTSYLKGQPMAAFIIRKEPKKHGTQAWIEGEIKNGMKVVLLEDVITTGGSVLQAVHKAQENGLHVLGVLVIVDRQEGGREALEKEGLAVESLFTKEELLG